jgi:outer membrane protein assembly factor BamB
MRAMRIQRAFLVIVLAFCGAAGALAATDAMRHWPQWRGPAANGVAPFGDPPVEWAEDRNVRWKVKVPGYGTSTPIIWGTQVFIQTAIATGRKPETGSAASRPDTAPLAGRGGPGPGKVDEVYQWVLLCYDRTTGDVLWQKVAREELPHEGHHQDHGFASASPVTDGERVFAHFGSRGLYCYDLQGNLKWDKDLGRMQTRNGFGEGSSPALYGDTIVVNWDHEGDDFIVALDQKTGKELWRQKRDEHTTWSTPLVVEFEGKPQVVVSATGKVRSYDLKTGGQIWECAGMTANVIPTPVSGFGMVYPISGFQGNALLAIRLGKTGDLTDSDAISWSHHRGTPYVPSPLLYDDRIYFLGGNNGVLSCFDAKQGKAVIEQQRLEGIAGVYASPVGAGGRIYVVGRDGSSIVLKRGDTVDVLARNKLGDRIDASPAVVGKELFLRGHQYLYCIAEREKS